MTPLQQIGCLHDVLLDVEVELDRKVVAVQEILDLDKGTILKMTRSAGENIDIFVGGTLIAFGEIVLVEDTVAVRITDFNIEE
jgi:flagellar motor switch protein FliN/FliY